MKVPSNVLSTPEQELREDFRKFLWLVWRHIQLPEPTEVQYDIARFIQHGPRRKMVMAFRGVGKTYIFGAYIAWCLLRDPNKKILIVSGNSGFADQIAAFVRQLIRSMPVLNHLKPREGQKDTNNIFDVGPADVSKDPSVKSVGIFGQITGSRADEALMDDVETLDNSATEAGRQRLSGNIQEIGGAVLKPGGSVTYLGTPQSALSMYGDLPERGYTVRVWTARVPQEPEVYGGTLAPFIQRMIMRGDPAGTPVDPKRFNEEELVEREAEFKKAGWELQFMLNTRSTDAERFPLKLHNLMVMALDPRMAPNNIVWGREEAVEGVHNAGLPGDRYYRPIFRAKEMSPYDKTVMAIDPSGRGKDETSYAVVKHLHGMLYLMDAGGFTSGYEDDTLEGLAKVAKRWGVNKVVAESNFGDGMFVKLLAPHLRKHTAACEVEEVRAVSQKEQRILDVLEPLLAQHKLVVHEDLINRDFETCGGRAVRSLFFQMTRLTSDKGSLAHDDRLDALSWAINEFRDQMELDTETAAREAEEAAEMASIEEWIEEAGGIGGGGGDRYHDNMLYNDGPASYH